MALSPNGPFLEVWVPANSVWQLACIYTGSVPADNLAAARQSLDPDTGIYGGSGGKIIEVTYTQVNTGVLGLGIVTSRTTTDVTTP